MTPWQLRQIKQSVSAGGVIAYPTEAVYGLGCDPNNHQAVMKILQIKQREMEKGLILIASSQEQLSPYIAPPAADIQSLLDNSWPGPVTWLLEPRQHVPVWITGNHPSIAVRVTAHPIARQICDFLGHALISTSANISQRKPARDSLSAHRIFQDQVDMIVPGDTGQQKNPCEIRDAKTLNIIRPA